MPLPDGFTLDSSSAAQPGNLPDGFTIDAPAAASAPPGVAEDVAKSAAIGPVKGAIDIAGMPGQLATLVGGVVRKAVQHFNPNLSDEELSKREGQFWDQMNDPKNMETMAAFGDIPSAPLTPSDIQGEVEKSTGKLYQPQTTPGKFAQATTEGVPAAIALGPEGVAANIAKLAVLPGVASEAAGEKLEGSPYEGAARFIGGLAGGVGGMAAGKGIQGVGNYMAGRNAASQIAPDVNSGAVSRMANSFAANKLTPDIVQARQDALGPESMMLDMGGQMRGRAAAIAAQPGEGQQTVLDAVNSRVHGVDPLTGLPNEQFGAQTAQRVKSTLDQQLGTTHNKVDLLNGVNDAVDKMAKPLYDQVMADHPVVNVPDSITSRPAVASAMKNAVNLAKNYGEDLTSPTETNTILKGPGYHIADDTTVPAQPSLRYWDYVKKSLDARINNYMSSGGTADLNSADKADLGGLISARNSLRDNLDQQTGGAYAQARQVWSAKPQLNDAYETGFNAFSNKLLPEEFADQINDMSIPEQTMAKAGYRRSLEQLIDTSRNDGAKARSLLDTNSNLQKTENLFGPDARQAVEDRIGAETQFQQAANKIAGNSETAARLQTAKDTESPSVASPPTANLTGFLYKGLGSGLGYLRNQGMENTRAGIGQMSTMSGGDLTNLAKVLAGYNANRALNVGASVPKQSGALARALIANPATGPFSTQPSQQ